VKWENYPVEDNTKEPLQNMWEDQEDYVREYFAELKLKVVQNENDPA
jgi:hypothetical protein